MIRHLAISILLLAIVPTTFAQLLVDRLDDSLAHVHPKLASSQLPAGMIDGAKTPEQITDSTAYRLFLITVAEVPNPTEQQKNRQVAFLRTAGLDDDDIQAAIGVLATFKIQYLDLISRYNESVDEANKSGAPPDIAAFLRQRDDPRAIRA